MPSTYDQTKRYRARYPEKRRAEKRRYYQRHGAKVRARWRLWYAAHRAERAEYHRAYRRTHPPQPKNPERRRAERQAWRRRHRESMRRYKRRSLRRAIAELRPAYIKARLRRAGLPLTDENLSRLRDRLAAQRARKFFRAFAAAGQIGR